LFAENDTVERDLVVHTHDKVKVISKAEREAKNRLSLGVLEAHLLSLVLLQKKQSQLSWGDLHCDALL